MCGSYSKRSSWRWRAGVGKVSIPGKGMSMCKGPEAGGIVTLSGLQKRRLVW